MMIHPAVTGNCLTAYIFVHVIMNYNQENGFVVLPSYPSDSLSLVPGSANL